MKRINKYLIFISIIIVLSFVLPRLIPGSPLFAMSEDVSSPGLMTNEAFKAFEDYYAPDLPILQQFWRYVKKLLALDLGYSFYYKMPVSRLIRERIVWTFLLSFISIIVSLIIGSFLGIRSGLKDRESRFMMTILLSIQAIPTFLIGAIFQIIIAYKLRLLPPTGAYSPGMTPGQAGYLADVLRHMVLPLLVLIISGLPSTYIFAKNSSAKIKQEQFVKMARYLNIGRGDIYYKYIFKNIIPELLGRLNIQFILAITGSIFVEATFSYPGLGQLLRSAISHRDYPLLQGILLTACIYGLIVNFIFETVVSKNIKGY